MIDYFKIWVTDNATVETLWSNLLLYVMGTFEKVSKVTGEIYTEQIKEFEGITFKKEPHYPTSPNEGVERIVIGFKPHYRYNDGMHNANDFTALMCIETVKRFIETFNLKAFENYPINNLEYGLNFVLNGMGKELVGYNIYHSRNMFNQHQDHRYAKRAQSYNTKGHPNPYAYAKLYAKGFQYPNFCPMNTLRFEVGTKKRANVKNLGIYNISDLLNIETYHRLKSSLLKNAGKILIIDHLPNKSTLSNRDKNLLTKYSNSAFWFEILQRKRSATFNEKKQTYFGLLDKTGCNINQEFQKGVREKLEILLPVTCINSPPLPKSEKRKDSPLDKGVILTAPTSSLT